MRLNTNIGGKFAFLLLIGLASLPLLAEGFYENDVVNTLKLKFSNDSWDSSLDAIYEQDSDGDGEYDRLSATAIINDIEYEQVGVRYKGNSSYSTNNAKNPFNIKLDYILDQDYEGYGTLKLSNVFKDPSFVRETLAYEIARKYMAAPEANYMNVYVYSYSTGTYQYLGLYTNVESIDKTFLADRLHSSENARFKCNPVDGWNASSQGNGASLEYLGTEASSYYDAYILKTDDPNHWDDLIDLTYDIKYNTEYFDDAVDLDRAIWMLVFNNVIVNLDSYTGPSRQNYYLYKNDDGRWDTIVWDLNQSFGSFTDTGTTSGGFFPVPGIPGETTNLSSLDLLLRDEDDGWPLLNVILGNDTYKKIYLAHMRTMVEENFSNGWYETRALEIQDAIDAYVQADTNKFYTYADFVGNIADTRQQVTGIAELMDARVTYLNTQSVFTASGPTIANVTTSSENPDANTSVSITATVSNATSVLLAYRDSDLGKFEKIAMADDGNSDDGTAGDGTYGVSLSLASADVEYYIYAENSNAAMLSPERAEYEFYTIEVSPVITAIPSVVINEFMASNEATIQDPDDSTDYPDWIELYNSGDSTVDLGGMYLTDDLEEPTQWQIPNGISIEPGGYVVFWADKDTEEGDYHAGLKLSTSGESIGLFDVDSTGNQLIDSIEFGEQETDISYGRVGDGNANWQFISCPSPGAANPSLSDLDGDCIVNLTDFALFETYWMTADGADFNGDGSVDSADLIIFSVYWLDGI